MGYFYAIFAITGWIAAVLVFIVWLTVKRVMFAATKARLSPPADPESAAGDSSTHPL